MLDGIAWGTRYSMLMSVAGRSVRGPCNFISGSKTAKKIPISRNLAISPAVQYLKPTKQALINKSDISEPFLSSSLLHVHLESKLIDRTTWTFSRCKDKDDLDMRPYLFVHSIIAKPSLSCNMQFVHKRWRIPLGMAG